MYRLAVDTANKLCFARIFEARFKRLIKNFGAKHSQMLFTALVCGHVSTCACICMCVTDTVTLGLTVPQHTATICYSVLQCVASGNVKHTGSHCSTAAQFKSITAVIAMHTTNTPHVQNLVQCRPYIVYSYVRIYIDIYVYIYMYAHTCMYVYMHIYIYVYIYIYTYICMYMSVYKI